MPRCCERMILFETAARFASYSLWVNLDHHPQKHVSRVFFTETVFILQAGSV